MTATTQIMTEADTCRELVTPKLLNAGWAKSRDHASPQVIESLCRLCVEAQEAFPLALNLLRPWLQPQRSPNYLVRRLHKCDLCRLFPEAALGFLDLVFGEQTPWPPSDLRTCLETIRTAAPELNG